MRLWYFAGVALIAAAVSDPIVESCANAGWLGTRVRDDDHASVLPALLLGCLLVLALCVRAAFARRRVGAPRDGLRKTIAQLAAGARFSDIAPVLTLQLSAVLAMESAEQLPLDGHLAAGSSWLGGNAPLTLALHVAIGIIVSWCAAHTVRFLARGVRLIVDAAFARFGRWTNARAVHFRSRRGHDASAFSSRCRMPFTGGRAPPLHALP